MNSSIALQCARAGVWIWWGALLSCVSLCGLDHLGNGKTLSSVSWNQRLSEQGVLAAALSCLRSSATALLHSVGRAWVKRFCGLGCYWSSFIKKKRTGRYKQICQVCMQVMDPAYGFCSSVCFSIHNSKIAVALTVENTHFLHFALNFTPLLSIRSHN